MRYLITGGCGFIGSHLADALLGAGHDLVVIDDLSTGKRSNLPPHVSVIEGDIATPGIFDSVLESIDGCFHLAAIASVQKSKEEWYRTHQVNASGTVHLLDAIARAKRPIAVVYASSAAVYGDCRTLPIRETLPLEPLTAYGVDKLASEWHAGIASAIHGIPTAGLRFFNVYGPRQDPRSPYSGVISIFADKIPKHQPVSIFGDGGQTRDFVEVSDVVRCMRSAMERLHAKTLHRAVFNVCTGVGTSILELAHIIAQLSGSAAQIRHEAARSGDIRASLGDGSHAEKILGFKSVLTLKDGLRRIV